MTKPAPVTADRLRSFIERIERLIEERQSIQSDIKDVFSEAKSVGYDVRTMRRIIQLRAQDSADRAEQEALLDTYLMALGMTNGHRSLSEEDLEERATRVASEVDRLMTLVVNGKPPKIAAIQAEIGCSAGKASRLRGMVEDRISRSNAIDREIPAHDAETGELIESSGQPEPTQAAAAAPASAASPLDPIVASHATASTGGAPPADEPVTGGEARPGAYYGMGSAAEIDLTIPDFLDRRRTA